MPLAYNSRGLAYWNVGQYEQAIQDHQRAIKLEPGSLEAHLNLANDYLVVGQFDLANQAYMQVIAINPNFANLYNNLGLCLALLGNFDAAFQDFDQAIRLDHSCWIAYQSRGTFQTMLGQYEKALASFDKAIQIDPNETSTYMMRGRCLLEMGNLDQAIGDLQKCASQPGGVARPIAISCLALAYALKGDRDSCRKTIDECLPAYQTRDGNSGLVNAGTFLYIARAQLKLDDAKAARQTLAKIQSDVNLLGTAQQAELKAISAMVEQAEGEPKLAETDMNDALKICSSDAFVRKCCKSLAEPRNQAPSSGKSAGLSSTAINWKIPPNFKANSQDSPSENVVNSQTVTESLAEAVANRPIADKWAMVIGVSKFLDPTIPTLHYASKDAKDFADFLIKNENFAPDHVRVLLDAKATRDEIVTELEDTFLPRVVKPDDLVVFFFSSHGSPAGRTYNNENFLISYDTKKTRLLSTGIEMQELTRIIREKCKADRILIVMDACHSGGGADGAKESEGGTNFDVKNITLGHGQLIISSSSEQQRSWESKRYPNGVFTCQLMEGLRAKGSLTRLGDAVKETAVKVADEVQQDQAQDQTPVINNSHWRGDELMLGAPPTRPRPLPAAVKQLLP
jgi:tetratricopeptide (TPR) repeat protein/uncharacterized caspase-like protein